MKTKVYLRVAKDGGRGPKVAATMKPSHAPLKKAAGTWNEEYLPTVAFAVELEIPDEAFTAASDVLASLEIPAERVEVAAEIA